MERTWHRVDGELDEGRVRTVVINGRTIALTRCGGRYGALDNHCPHQGGPLGEGSIENGWLRCPWHGYDYDPRIWCCPMRCRICRRTPPPPPRGGVAPISP